MPGINLKKMENKNILKSIIELRHTLHACPELSMKESRTKQIIEKFLRDNTSFEVVDCGNWFYAVKYAYRQQAEMTSAGAETAAMPIAANAEADALPIAFRAELDALPMEEDLELPYASCNPGVSHKCGHDGHMAALCGLAMTLENRHLFRTVYLIFQPGEETGSGAIFCRDLLREKGISGIYAFHNLSGYPEGTMVYHPGVTQPASEGLRIRLTGKTSHAAEPEKGISPVHALVSIMLYAEKLAKDEQEDLLLCTVTGLQAGTGDFGISPGDGELCMTLRSDAESKMKALEHSILKYAENCAEKEGLKMEYQILDYFPETRNHPDCIEKVKQAAEMAEIPMTEMDSIWRPSEDFGYYLKEIPGAMFYIGNGADYPAVHTCAYDFNDRILEAAVDIFCILACGINGE